MLSDLVGHFNIAKRVSSLLCEAFAQFSIEKVVIHLCHFMFS